jgi:diguanylate cyclase (GGDEF)-like protein
MDIDRFKTVNDTYGHQAGDEVLKHFAKIITSAIRPGDVCCRFGGEEFIALISHVAADEAYLVAERIRSTFEKSVNPIGRPITVSQGIAHYSSHSFSAEELIQMADQAMYKAKQSGRNQTIIAEESLVIKTPKRPNINRVERRSGMSGDTN